VNPPIRAYRGDEPYVFVCYSHSDSEQVYHDIQRFSERGLHVWYDEGISPGTEWSEELAHSLENAGRLVFFVSKASAESRHCRDEVHFALNHNIPIVTVYLEEVALPSGLELSIGRTQAVLKYDLSDSLYLQKLGDILPALKVEGSDSSPTDSSNRARPRWLVPLLVGLVVVAGGLFSARNHIMSYVIINMPFLFTSAMHQEVGFATTTDKVRIAYATTGSGPPIVIVLGWATHLQEGMDSPTYDAQGLLALTSENHMVVRYDGRGFGLSDRDVTDFSLEARVRDIEAVVDALKLDRFALYVMSAGGPAGIAYAHKHQEKITHLILAGTMVSLRHYVDQPQRLENFNRTLPLFETNWESPAVTNLFVDILAPDAPEFQRRVMGEFLRRSGHGRAIYGFYTVHMQLDVEHLAAELTMPTLVLHAEDDNPVPLEAGRISASLIPGSKFRVIEGDHGPSTGNSLESREIILDFIDNTPASVVAQ
jgi:pimeloyl-ACP methyl ester carboxylesterase